jgi:uncharacterized membrane protein
MKPIDSKTHGTLDYAMGIFLIVAPSIFGLDKGQPESVILYALGIAALVYSLITDYELGIFKILPFRIHLTLDVLSGIFLSASPWLLDFADRVYLPHVILGLIEIAAGVMTRSQRRQLD